jgi:hypothetical protein
MRRDGAEMRRVCRIRPVGHAPGWMPTGGAYHGRGPDITDARGAGLPGHHQPCRSLRTRPRYADPYLATRTPRHPRQAPPPAPPAAAGRRHRFPGSHGPTERKVNEQWLTLRCYPRAWPRSAPTVAQPAISKIPRNPRVAGTPANSAKAGPLRRARWSARPQIHPCPCGPPQLSRADEAEQPKEPKSRRNPEESSLGRQQRARRSQPAPTRARSWPRSCALPRGPRPAHQAHSTRNRPRTWLPVA